MRYKIFLHLLINQKYFNKHFFDIEMDDSISKNQEGEILTFYGNKGIYKDRCLLKVKLGFKIVSSKDDFIIQDEQIYRDEQDYFKNINAELNEITVNELLDKQLNSDSNAIRIGTSYISKVFDIIGTSYTYEDIFKNVDYENLTVRKYASHVFSICSYLDSEMFDNIFRKRMIKQYYNPEEILNLTMFDKIPELLCNDNKFNDQVIKYMTYKINKDMKLFKLLNLIREDDFFPENFQDFKDEYLDDNYKFLHFKNKIFLDKISGYISYLNREKDARQFAYPIIYLENVDMSSINSNNETDEDIFNLFIDEIKEYIDIDLEKTKEIIRNM